MAEAKSAPQPTTAVPATATATTGGQFRDFIRMDRPKFRVTTAYDSDSSVFLHKVSCKLLDDLAKLKMSFSSNNNGEVWEPQVSFTSKFFSLHYDVEERDALLKASFEASPGLNFKASHQFKARQGEVTMIADLASPDYKLELSSFVPSVGKPKATFKFPLGEVSLEEKEAEEEEQKKALSVSGILKYHILNGLYTAKFVDENMDLRYAFKDEQMTFIPSI